MKEKGGTVTVTTSQVHGTVYMYLRQKYTALGFKRHSSVNYVAHYETFWNRQGKYDACISGLSNDVYLFRGAIFRAFRAADVIRSDVIVAFVLTLSLLRFGGVDVLQEVVAAGARRRWRQLIGCGLREEVEDGGTDRCRVGSGHATSTHTSLQTRHFQHRAQHTYTKLHACIKFTRLNVVMLMF